MRLEGRIRAKMNRLVYILGQYNTIHLLPTDKRVPSTIQVDFLGFNPL
jgi:hypothetical protein